MKSVLVSNRPKWCEKICHEIEKDENGKPIYEKRIEVRKTAPNEVPFKAYIYCTGGKLLFKSTDGNLYISRYFNYKRQEDVFNGKVIGEFICDKVYEWKYDYCDGVDIDDDLILETCLDREDINIYAKGKTVYGWHIYELKIYDKPKELSEFNRPCVSPTHDCEDCIQGKTPYTWDFDEDKGTIFCTRKIKIPPQSWQYVEEL